MKSTGEVMGIDSDFDMAFGKALIGGGMRLPDGGTVFVSVKDADKDNILPAVRKWLSSASRSSRREGRRPSAAKGPR